MAASTAAVFALLLAGTTVHAQRDYKGQSLDLLRLLAEKPWIGLGPHNRWDRAPSIDADIETLGLDRMSSEPISPAGQPRYQRPSNLDPTLNPRSQGPGGMEIRLPPIPGPARMAMRDNDDTNFLDDEIRSSSEKRSAVATALNSGRRRRQPTPALGKAVGPYMGVGVLNDVGSFFDTLRDNLETLVSLSPQERSSLFQDPPHVVHAPASNNGGGGSGGRKLYALRPLRPTGNIRSYNRRSFVETDGVYPGANHHDPGLLWTGLGR